MTHGTWKCVACGYKETCLIYKPFPTCPECGAEYDVEYLSGVHFVHPVAVHKLKNSEKTTAASPHVFATSMNPDAENFKKWRKALKSHRL